MELHDENLKAKIEKKKTKIRKMLGKLVFFLLRKFKISEQYNYIFN